MFSRPHVVYPALTFGALELNFAEAELIRECRNARVLTLLANNITIM